MRRLFLIWLLLLLGPLPQFVRAQFGPVPQPPTAQTLPGVVVSSPRPLAPSAPSSSQFAADAAAPPGALIMTGAGPMPPTLQPPALFQQPAPGSALQPAAQDLQPEHAEPAEIKFNLRPQDNLFNYTWIDFGEGHGLRIHRLEWTNGWTDMRAPDFFTKPTDARQQFQAGLGFAVQWWKERPRPDPWPYGASIPPPVLYDLYLDLDWRAEVAPGWVVDVALSPGFSTDFRVTPPDGFRMRGHAITMVDIGPALRGVLGLWYLNRNSTKLLPVAGFVWQGWRSRIEAVFPQPRLVYDLGCWKDRQWEFTLGGEFGGGGWAFKNPEGARETIDYRDFRAVTGITWIGKHGQGWLEVGYVFERELRYAQHQGFGYDPGNAFMARIGWAY